MCDSPSIGDVSFEPARPADADGDLLGFVSLTIAGALRLNGIALWRTTVGDLALSFPMWRDQDGRERACITPVDDEVRCALHDEVLHELALQGIVLPSWAPPRHERRELPRALPSEIRREAAEADHDAEELLLKLGARHAHEVTA